MDSTQSGQKPNHRRGKSASVLMSMISSKPNKRIPSDDKVVSPRPMKENAALNPFLAGLNTPILPQDHPHAGHRVLGEITPNNNQQQSPRRPAAPQQQRPPMHMKSASTMSLHTIGKDKDESKMKSRESPTKSTRDDKSKPKKTKSSTNLASVFAKVKSQKPDSDSRSHAKDKENTPPPASAVQPPPTPIWAQFASTAKQEMAGATKIPHNDGRTVAEEIALYEPKEYSPSKQRHFYGCDQPTLGSKPRPKSEAFSGNPSKTSILDAVTRRISDDSNGRRRSLIGSRRSSSEEESGHRVEKSRSSKSKLATLAPTEDISMPKRTSRVRAAVAAINNLNVRTNKTVKERSGQAPDIDPKEIDAAFEAVLDSRNIPENMRQGMRSLKPRVKSEFIRSWENEKTAPAPRSPETDPFMTGDSAQVQRTASGASSEGHAEASAPEDSKSSSTKRSRPRSKTFTFSKRDKGDSPAKKPRPETGLDSKRASKEILPKSPSSTSIASSGSGFFGRAPKAAVPQDYVTYLRRKQDLKEIELGRMHKLRLLLRNETVQWVTSFIELGGMDEIVSLLHRIMEVEWREDHEDQVLHEALLCLKALCTTDLALQKLCEIEKTLFPALLAMIFDPEHKGPSEFTTRQVITNILLAHLTAAVTIPDILPFRAQTLLSYLADPSPPDEKKPIPFILDMRRNRPYKLWVNETSSVAKEIFWIFIHHLNVVPLPPGETPQKIDGSVTPPTPKQQPDTRDLTAEEYLAEFFPRQRPPVPAAPYIGGVEWDATNYIASHLDLINALIASTPTREERNALRTELQVSGLEKLMGGFLRTCKEKYYGSVHDGLKTWVAAAGADGWEVRDVRMGPRESPKKSPRKSPVKKNDPAPKLEAPPVLDLGMSLGIGKVAVNDWL
ncbi:Diaphanous GTPase-binding protein [Venturia nashicola]|nr:Diaphanous GTPase-binding protein [Venturia nashicola]